VSAVNVTKLSSIKKRKWYESISNYNT
jgi:hypothetical protein